MNLRRLRSYWMFRYLTSFFLCVCLLTSCKDNGLEIVKDEQGNILEQFQKNQDTGLRDGLYEAFYPDGTIKEKAHYKSGILEDERILYFPNGQKLIVETYKAGSFEGPYYEFHEGEVLAAEGKYIGGNMEGIWKYYYPDGSLREEVTFSQSEENGPFTEFHSNGNISAKGNYKGGDYEHGIIEIFDSTGTLIRKMDCDLGKCKTIWKKEGLD